MAISRSERRLVSKYVVWIATPPTLNQCVQVHGRSQKYSALASMLSIFGRKKSLSMLEALLIVVRLDIRCGQWSQHLLISGLTSVFSAM